MSGMNSQEPIRPEPNEVEGPGEDLYKQGWQEYAKGQYTQAINSYNQALQLMPNHPDILYALALSQEAAEQHETAIKTFQRAIDNTHNLKDDTRAKMIERMANGHIAKIMTGNWNMNSEELKGT